MMQDVMKHRADIVSGMADAETKWIAGDYYGSGQALGTVEKLAMSYWWPS